MPTSKPTSPVKASTQAFVEIEEIRDDIILMKDFSACVVIEVGAVNFWLLSVEEQSAMIYSYAGLLISLYLDYLQGKIILQQVELIKNRLESYKEFIKTIVKKNTVLEKRFFFVVPFSTLEMGVSGVNTKSLNKEYVISRAKTSLYPKRDHLIRLLSKIGLRVSTLQRQELVELFFNLYNSSPTGKRMAPVESYTDVVLTTG